MDETPVADLFRENMASYELTVLRDDKTYRHLRFMPPGTGLGWFDLITWPGRLAFTRDPSQELIFARLDDMFAFFRGTTVNLSYWAEKLTTSGPVREYSVAEFRRHVLDYLDEWSKEQPLQRAGKVRAAVQADILDDPEIVDEMHARRLVADFTWYQDPGDISKSGIYPDFTFDDAWEWDLTEWTYWYEWACHAIQWAITQYDTWRETRHDCIAEDAPEQMLREFHTTRRVHGDLAPAAPAASTLANPVMS